MSPTRDPFAHYRDLMAARAFRPSRARGQNFLLDPSLHRAIADAADLDAGALVLEVGTGLGFLTRELAARAADVVTVEVDERLAAIVADELPGWPHAERVRLVGCDALAGEALAAPVVAALAAVAAGRSAIVVANLPYSIAGRFLAVAMLQDTVPIERVVAVVQLELAERLAADPGTRAYGGLSALAQAWGRVDLVRRIGREVFRPRPRVDSALIRIDRRGAALPAGFAAFVRTLFQARRKTLRHALRGLGGVPPAVVDAWGGKRAEALRADELLALFAEVATK